MTFACSFILGFSALAHAQQTAEELTEEVMSELMRHASRGSAVDVEPVVLQRGEEIGERRRHQPLHHLHVPATTTRQARRRRVALSDDEIWQVFSITPTQFSLAPFLPRGEREEAGRPAVIYPAAYSASIYLCRSCG